MQHEQFQDLLDTLVKRSGVGQEVLGEVLARTSLRAPAETSRVEISAGNPAARRAADQRAIPQGTVSKAVKALMDEHLLEDGEKLLRNQDGRTLSPLRFGSLYAIAGVKVVQSRERPTRVTTALVGSIAPECSARQTTQTTQPTAGTRWPNSSTGTWHRSRAGATRTGPATG